jgi:pyruvate/2-oxoacid:ferredoxin oxidoreductase alpha subunit
MGTTAEQRILLKGNHAISYGVMRARPQVVPIYPITPQTPIVEKITELVLSGDFDTDIMTAESEHSAMSAAITASLTGVRVFTASASQGLFLMHEMLHYASGARVPIVMALVNRTLGSPWGFWPDQTDSLAQRDTGWIHIYSESGQESLDSILMAYKLAETVSLPVFVCHEAFYVSHALEPVVVPSQDAVDEFLPPFNPVHRLHPSRKESWGNVVTQEMFNRHRRDMWTSMNEVPALLTAIDAEYQNKFGRGYGGPYELYRADDAEMLMVGFGSMVGTMKDAVDALREQGIRVGLLKVRLFRPFPVELMRQAVADVPKLVVMERNYSPGAGGVLYQELKAALFGTKNQPLVHGYLAGVGGLDVPVERVQELALKALAEDPAPESVWV